MPLAEILSNSAPAIGGLLVTAAALLYARSARRRGSHASAPRPAAHHPAE